MQLTWLIGKRLVEASKRIDDWMLRFEGDSTLITECLWRVVNDEGILVTSLDQGQRSTICVNRGGDDEIVVVFRDAGDEMVKCLQLATIRSAFARPLTNDLRLDFDNSISVQIIFDRSDCGGWCLQSPGLNLVAIGNQLALHVKQTEPALDEQRVADEALDQPS